jgi:hypothetical protein
MNTVNIKDLNVIKFWKKRRHLVAVDMNLLYKRAV